MHELLRYFSSQSLFSTEIIPYAVYQVVTYRKYWRSRQGYSLSVNTTEYAIVLTRVATCDSLHVTNLLRCCSQLPCMPTLHSKPCATLLCQYYSDSHYMVTWYVHNINFNELLWNYEFIIYKNLLSSDLFKTKIWNRKVFVCTQLALHINKAIHNSSKDKLYTVKPPLSGPPISRHPCLLDR